MTRPVFSEIFLLFSSYPNTCAQDLLINFVNFKNYSFSAGEKDGDDETRILRNICYFHPIQIRVHMTF